MNTVDDIYVALFQIGIMLMAIICAKIHDRITHKTKLKNLPKSELIRELRDMRISQLGID